MSKPNIQPRPELSAVEDALVAGNLAALNPGERVVFYRQVCDSLGLNPWTQPFDYVTLNGKLRLYPKKDCTDQLRRIHEVSITIVSRETMGDIHVVTARATMPSGRTHDEVGAVAIGGLKGEAAANALMKAHTKAVRRATLAICGLGWTDESELDSIPDARPEPAPRPALPAPRPQNGTPPQGAVATAMREFWQGLVGDGLVADDAESKKALAKHLRDTVGGGDGPVASWPDEVLPGVQRELKAYRQRLEASQKPDAGTITHAQADILKSALEARGETFARLAKKLKLPKGATLEGLTQAQYSEATEALAEVPESEG